MRDTDEEKASLKRVLLAYARWNKSVGYCQGFNVIAALILQVMEGNEEEALKVFYHITPNTFLSLLFILRLYGKQDSLAR